jgi:O-antigen/teichoic acid export membrane protein
MQGFSLLVLSWCLLRNKLIFLPLLPFFWSKPIFKEIFSYAFNFQINAIAIILFDPVVKMFMSRYGGLSNTAYFEMASQLVTKLRSLITAAIQVLVPTIAEVHETAPEKIREIYLKSYSITFLISVPFYIALIIALPIIGMAWLGPVASNFLIFSSIIAFGWGFNTLSVPAYFVNLGTGDLKSNTIAHVVMISFIFPLGFLLGHLFGSTGIALSSMLSILISSFIVLYAASKKYKVSLHSLFPREHLNLLFASMFFLAFSILLNLSNLQSATIYIFEVVNLISYIGAVIVIFWLHPSKNSMIKLLRSQSSNSI